MNEEWMDIPGYEGIYQISSHGNIRSLPRIRKHRWNSEKVFKGRLRKPVKVWNGYLAIALRKEGEASTFLVHRLVASAFIDNIYNKPYVNHKDGNKENNYFENLEWVTHQENCKHAFQIGLRKPGNPNKGWKTHTERRCAICEIVKPIKEFSMAFIKKYNVYKPGSYCHPCRKEKQKILNRRYQQKLKELN